MDITDQIKALDLRQIASAELTGSKCHSHTKYDQYACVFHGETHGTSLTIYANGWTCWGKCAEGGDAIKFIQRVHHLTDFGAAVRYIKQKYLNGIDTVADKKTVVVSAGGSEPPSADWQRAARCVIDHAQNMLWSQDGKRALDYLRGRGLDDVTIRAAQLGYIIGAPDEWRKIDGLNVPCGIVIPWLAAGAVWGLKVRRAAGNIKYQQVAGGNIKGGLYQADMAMRGADVMLTEGEFDALILQQESDGTYWAAALGSAANTNISVRWYPVLIAAPRLYAVMDNDDAGRLATQRLGMMTAAARPYIVPAPYKDVNEFMQADKLSFYQWLDARS